MIDERHEELAALHALDLLEGDERTQFEAALARDPALAALVAELRETAAALAHAAPPAEPPAALKARVLASLASRRPAVVIRPPPSVFRPLLPWLVAACFAVSTAWFAQLHFASRSEASLLHDQQTIADLALRSARTQLETERLLARQQRTDLDRQVADATRQLADTTARLTSTDELLANTRRDLAAARATASQQLAALDQQLAAERAKSSDAARLLDAAKQRLVAQDARLAEQLQRIAAIETTAKRESDLAQFKITTLASLLKNSPQALAVAVWNPGTQQGVLQVDKLPALAADKDYQLWVVDPQYPNPVDGGVFTVDPKTGVARIAFTAKQPVKAINAFAVTLERKGGVPKAEGPFVLLGK